MLLQRSKIGRTVASASEVGEWLMWCGVEEEDEVVRGVRSGNFRQQLGILLELGWQAREGQVKRKARAALYQPEASIHAKIC